ncbi:uncharacterized protein LOC125063527 [Pieris napi]|uniref:uncharacterized protein LOC125063527 n=1 Tax=Pieris napi TaxID=78633 RepID=UPI001FBB20C2|nr:uncharacterized protein LOC125063527 [Pieris napi]
MSCNSKSQGDVIIFDNSQNVEELYTYMNVDKLLSTAERHNCKFWKCRTVGILKSVNGHFYLNDIYEESNLQAPKLLVSMLYQDDIPNSILPMTVQLFGIMQWIEKPVLFVEIIHIINPRTAVNIQNSLSSIINDHTNNKPL